MRNRKDRENFSDEEEEEEEKARLPPYGDAYYAGVAYTPESISYRSPSPVPDILRFRPKTPAPPVKSSPIKENLLWIILAICAVLLAAYSFTSTATKVEDNKINCSLFLNLENKLPGQDQKLFKFLKAGVEGVINGETMVMSLFSTDSAVIDNVMQEVIKATQNCLNQSQDPISLTSEHLGPKMIENYKEALNQRSIMIINNVEEAEPLSVSSLHSFCDTYNPLVSRAIIFITIKVPTKPKGKPVEYITDFLNQQWKTVPDHIRNPLITRMLDQTFFLQP